ncbi:hypothetical protein ACFCP7_06645 [Paenibacillus elgii]
MSVERKAGIAVPSVGFLRTADSSCHTQAEDLQHLLASSFVWIVLLDSHLSRDAAYYR